jgi:hypothetical protein
VKVLVSLEEADIDRLADLVEMEPAVHEEAEGEGLAVFSGPVRSRLADELRAQKAGGADFASLIADRFRYMAEHSSAPMAWHAALLEFNHLWEAVVFTDLLAQPENREG